MEPAIRLLTPEDADAHVRIRAEMPTDSPFAFLAWPEDDVVSDPEFVRERLSAPDGANVIVGAFAPELVGTVSVKTPGARTLYERVGFRAWGTEPRAICVDGEYADETYMSLSI